MNEQNGQNQDDNLRGTINQSSDFPQTLVQKPKGKKGVVLGISIGLGVIIIGMGVVLAAGIWDPLWNPFRPSPNKVIMEAIDNLANIKSMRTKAEFTVTTGDATEGTTKIIMDAKEDKIDPQNPKSQALFDVSFVKGGVEITLSGETRSVDNVFYIDITTLPIVLTLQLSNYGIDVSPFVGKWYKFDPKEAGVNLALLNNGAESEKMQNEIMNLFKEYPLFKAKAKLRNEKIDDNLAYHYLVTIDNENAKDFLINVFKIVQGELGSFTPEQMSDEETTKEIEAVFDRMGEITFEIWIGVQDRYIYRIKGDKDFYTLDADNVPTDKMALDFELLFSEFNQPQEIVAPKDSSNIMDLLMPFFQAWFAGGATELPL